MIILIDEHASSAELETLHALLKENAVSYRQLDLSLGVVWYLSRSLQLPSLAAVSKVFHTPQVLLKRELQTQDSVFPLTNGSDFTLGEEQLLLGAVLPRLDDFPKMEVLLSSLYEQRLPLVCWRGDITDNFLQQLSAKLRRQNQLLMLEVSTLASVAKLSTYADVFELPATAMDDRGLLEELAVSGKPVLLQRGLAASITDWLRSAEILYVGGCKRIILGEQGHRILNRQQTLLDFTLIHQLREQSHLPLLIDPSFCCQDSQLLQRLVRGLLSSEVQALLLPVQLDDRAGQALGAEQRTQLLADIVSLGRLFERPLSLLEEKVTRKEEQSGEEIGFQGEEGAYSEQALYCYFNESVKSNPYKDFAGVFQAVRKGEIRAGVLPIENTLGGTLSENYNLLRHYPDLCVCGELRLRIQHNFIVAKGSRLENIKIVRSHPQALIQCAAFIENYQFKSEAVYDTAGAAKELAQHPQSNVAVIASTRAADVYNLKILQWGIETNHHNYTRFFVVEQRASDSSLEKERNKVSLMLSLNHRIGSLARVLNILVDYGCDLTKIESQPIYGEPWRYYFYIDARTPPVYSFSQLKNLLEDEVLELLELGYYCENSKIYQL